MEPSHQTVRLAQGRHPSPRLGACVMELASMLAGESFSDRPAAVSRVIAAFLRTYNDGIDDRRRQALYPLAASIVGTARGRAVERERVSRCLEFARELGASTPPGRAALGIATAEPSGSWAALAALRDGPSGASHSRALAFVRELIAVQPQGSGGRRPRWLFGWDPAQAVAEALHSGASDQASGITAEIDAIDGFAPALSPSDR